jgi:hypothetical protein
LSEPVGYSERLEAYLAASRAAQTASELWLEARAGGRVSVELEAGVDDALRVLRAATKKLEKARKRSEKNIPE